VCATATWKPQSASSERSVSAVSALSYTTKTLRGLSSSMAFLRFKEAFWGAAPGDAIAVST